jgi:hypothetical protein
MYTAYEIGWLAGILDGEGSLVVFKDKRANHGLNVHVTVNMVDKETIDRIGQMFRFFSGDRVPVREKRPLSGFSRRMQYVVDVSSKSGCLRTLEVLTPHLVTKKLQAELIMSILRRAVLEKKYRCSALDFATFGVIKQLKRYSGEARTEALQILGQVTPSQAPHGSVSTTDDRGEGVETRGLTPKDNDPHEPPAPNHDKGSIH